MPWIAWAPFWIHTFVFSLLSWFFFFTLNKILTWEINQEAWVLELSRRLTFVWVVAIENLINTCEANKYKNIHFSLNSLPSLCLTITAISSHICMKIMSSHPPILHIFHFSLKVHRPDIFTWMIRYNSGSSAAMLQHKKYESDMSNFYTS